jgi:flavorubredoxin
MKLGGTMVTSYRATPDIEVLTSNAMIPGFGLIPINAFVIKGSEPVLVDTGVVLESAEFMAALKSVIDPSELRWIWLTHTDFDHIGALAQLLAENPQLRVITTFMGIGIMGLSNPLPLDRVNLVNPGEKITLGDRTLVGFKPPVFDNPSTTGFYDEKSGVLFSSDCFGALLQDEVPQNAADISDDARQQGQTFWVTVDSPWIHKVDRDRFAKELDGIRQMAPKMVLSSHLPAAHGDLLEALLASLALAPDFPRFTGPDQAGLEQMLAEMPPPA